MTDTPVLTDSDIDTLNAARKILDRIAADAPHTWTGGVIFEAATHGESAIFRALNVYNSYGDAPDLTYEQLHGRPDPDAPVVRDPEAWQAVADAGHSVKA